MMDGGLANSKSREKFLKYYVSHLNCSFILQQENAHFVGTFMLQMLTMLILFYCSHGHNRIHGLTIGTLRSQVADYVIFLTTLYDIIF
jgi:hypothetical protein